MKFETPEIEVIKFLACEIITASDWNTGGDDL